MDAAPVFVGKPDLDWPDTDPFPSTAADKYSKFKEDQADRTAMVYVGANE